MNTNKVILTALLHLLVLFVHAQKTAVPNGNNIRVNEKHSLQKGSLPKTPDILWGKLFVDVQQSMILGDNKTFTDAVPKIFSSYNFKKIPGFN